MGEGFCLSKPGHIMSAPQQFKSQRQCSPRMAKAIAAGDQCEVLGHFGADLRKLM